jgi:hypothetical protein
MGDHSGGLCRAGAVEIPDCDRSPVPGQALRDGSADAGTAAGDNCGFSFK